MTIRKHAAGGSINEIEKEIVEGAVRYEAEIARNGKEFDILVSADGEYLGTDKDDDEDDTDHDDEHGC